MTITMHFKKVPPTFGDNNKNSLVNSRDFLEQYKISMIIKVFLGFPVTLQYSERFHCVIDSGIQILEHIQSN